MLTASLERLRKKLEKARDDKQKAAIRVINRGAMLIHGTAQKSFRAAKTGVMYAVNGRGSTRSAPGEAPAVDTGHLAQSTTFKLATIGEPVAAVVAAAAYALSLEFGSARMEPRPFMRPAYELHKDKIIADLKDALK